MKRHILQSLRNCWWNTRSASRTEKRLCHRNGNAKYQAVLAGTTNSADSSLEACGVHLGGGLLLAGRKGGNGLHSCGGWRYIFSIKILFKFCISENPGCKRERFYFLAQVEALVTKHYDDQVTEMVENNPRLDENLIEVIKE